MPCPTSYCPECTNLSCVCGPEWEYAGDDEELEALYEKLDASTDPEERDELEGDIEARLEVLRLQAEEDAADERLLSMLD